MEALEKRKVRPCLVDDKGTWTVRARVYDSKKGKTRIFSKSTGIKVGKNNRGKREAEQKMLEIAAVWEAQANAEVPELDPLFSDYVEKFLTRKGLSKRENTVLSYQGYARTWVLPYFGKAKVRDIRLSHLEAFLVEVLKTRSVSSAKKFFVVINGALTEAKRDGIIDRNFWDDIEYPQKKKF